jgi:hypothetical protein
MGTVTDDAMGRHVVSGAIVESARAISFEQECSHGLFGMENRRLCIECGSIIRIRV